ncbi:hypothetical protein [Massilia sp. METH4]|uniref:hypothetical protein n=1 Tax=Massilia sp. METH4 TaxID=3123041 RepID=UPI0030D4205C
MNTRFLAILLAGLVPVLASFANDAAAQASVEQSRQSSRALVTNQPYSAIQTVTVRRLLEDGDEFTRQTVTRLYRDSAGRTRRDTLDSDGELDHSIISGADGVRIFLDHRNELAQEREARPQPLMQDNLTPASAGKAPTVVEQLGQRDIEGVAATGRIARTQVGREGEDIEVTNETWYSEEMGMALYRKHSDPRYGDSIIEISDLDRSEPDPALFEAPEDYKLLTSHFRRN